MKTYGKVTGLVATLAALAVSGIALADHNPNHGTGKEKPKGSPGQVKSKSSISVVNLCEPASTNADLLPGAYLKVTSTITNESEQTVDIAQIVIDGFQLVPDRIDTERPDKKPKKVWRDVGSTQYPDNPMLPFPIPVDPEGVNPVQYEVYIDLCKQPTLRSDAVALNAKSQIVVDGVDGRNFLANCDDPDPDDDIDQSEIDLEDYPGLECPTP